MRPANVWFDTNIHSRLRSKLPCLHVFLTRLGEAEVEVYTSEQPCGAADQQDQDMSQEGDYEGWATVMSCSTTSRRGYTAGPPHARRRTCEVRQAEPEVYIKVHRPGSVPDGQNVLVRACMRVLVHACWRPRACMHAGVLVHACMLRLAARALTRDRGGT